VIVVLRSRLERRSKCLAKKREQKSTSTSLGGHPFDAALTSTRSRTRVNARGFYSFGSAEKEHLKLIYNCTAYLLTMAIADNALFGIESLDNLLKLEIPPGKEKLELSFKESALNRPILRICIKVKDIIEDKWSKARLFGYTEQ
jgi:hypothetical protein